jgi:hypothetical protein
LRAAARAAERDMRNYGRFLEKSIPFLAAVAIVVFALHVFSDNEADVDLWGNVGFVKSLPWQEGFHRHNTYSFTEPDHAWVNHEWLAEYVLHHVHARFGNPGLLALKVALGLALLALIHASARRECASGAARFLLLALVISVAGFGFSTRPHLFTYVLYAGALLALRHGRARSAAWVAGAALAGFLWANLHGAFFIGAVLLASCAGLSAVARRWGGATCPPPFTLLAALGAFVLASFANPYGWRLWRFLATSAAKPRPYLTEWAPFSPARDLTLHADFVVLVVLVAAAVALSLRARRDGVWLGVLALSLVAALVMRRNIPLFAITAALVTPPHLDAAFGRRLESLRGSLLPRPLLAVLLVGFIGLSVRGAVAFDKRHPLQMEVPRTKYPVDAVRFLDRNGLGGNALVFFDWAEYLIWHLYPRCRVFLDGRFNDAYENRTIDDYFAFVYQEGDATRALTAYDPTLALLHPGNPGAARLRAMPDWRVAYEDPVSVVFLKAGRHPAFETAHAAGTVWRPVAANDPAIFP